jgi:hypothetical protein
MNIKCRICGEDFAPDDDSMDQICAEFIDTNSVNICDWCWDLIEHSPVDNSEMLYDALD